MNEFIYHTNTTNRWTQSKSVNDLTHPNYAISGRRRCSLEAIFPYFLQRLRRVSRGIRLRRIRGKTLLIMMRINHYNVEVSGQRNGRGVSSRNRWSCDCNLRNGGRLLGLKRRRRRHRYGCVQRTLSTWTPLPGWPKGGLRAGKWNGKKGRTCRTSRWAGSQWRWMCCLRRQSLLVSCCSWTGRRRIAIIRGVERFCFCISCAAARGWGSGRFHGFNEFTCARM